ncbi:MAG TPA: ABC transporter permease [Halanaerobiales bacterium]|nr:ABC transporter permease [Halanaerobiales bacterium]
MFNLLYTELLKMKNSKMFLVSLLGSLVSPLLTFFMLTENSKNYPDKNPILENFFEQTQLFIAFLVGIMLFALITTYLFNREFEEDTLKNLLTIPVGRIKLILSKMLILLIWVETIMVFSYLLVVFLGLIGGFEGFEINILLLTFKKYIFTGFLLYLLTPVIILFTILFRSYIPSIALSIFATLTTLVLINSKYLALFPWGVPVLLSSGTFQFEYPLIISWIILIATFTISLATSLIYFARTDIN